MVVIVGLLLLARHVLQLHRLAYLCWVVGRRPVGRLYLGPYSPRTFATSRWTSLLVPRLPARLCIGPRRRI